LGGEVADGLGEFEGGGLGRAGTGATNECKCRAES